jgi:hypothetical protein
MVACLKTMSDLCNPAKLALTAGLFLSPGDEKIPDSDL